jgi:hypothetical protein
VAAVQRVVSDPDSGREVALHVVGLVRKQPALGALVEQRYAEAEQKMFVPELMLLTAALVVLAIRIKRVKVGDTEVSFYPAGDEVKTLVGGLVKAIGP